MFRLRSTTARTTTPANFSCRLTNEVMHNSTFSISHRINNGKYNAINIIYYIIIPKADYLVAD